MARNNTSLVPTAGVEQSPFGILSPATATYEYSDEYWTSGITYDVVDSNAVVSNGIIMGATGTLADVPVVDNSANSMRYKEYFPFDVKSSMKLSSFGITPEEVEKRAKDALNIVLQKAVEREFWDGDVSKLLTEDNDNRYLAGAQSVDLTPVAGTAVKPRYGQAILEQAIADSPLGGLGIIHATKDVASILKVKADGKTLRTNLGTPVVAGVGYSKRGPDGATADAGKAWMYATGPVSVHLGPVKVTPDRVNQSVDTRLNTVTYYVDRAAAVTFSTSTSYAVLVDLSLDYA